MKFSVNFLLASGILLLFSCMHHDKTASCCSAEGADANAAFVAFGKQSEFLNAHPAPLPTELTKNGKIITFPVAGGKPGRGFLVKSKHKTQQYLLLFHEWWGLNDYICNEAAMWSKELDVNVLAIDLYDGKVAATADEAGKLMQACDATRANAIIKGAAAFAGNDADFRTMGWCFGGGWSLRAALALGPQVKACVMYYGMPEQDPALLKTLHTDVVFIHPELDKWITRAVTDEFEQHMTEAGKSVKVYHYNADHAFANPSGPRYNSQAAIEARAVVKAYLLGK